MSLFYQDPEGRLYVAGHEFTKATVKPRRKAINRLCTHVWEDDDGTVLVCGLPHSQHISRKFAVDAVWLTAVEDT